MNHHNNNNLQVAQVMNFVLLTGSTKNQTFYPRMLKSLSQHKCKCNNALSDLDLKFLNKW